VPCLTALALIPVVARQRRVPHWGHVSTVAGRDRRVIAVDVVLQLGISPIAANNSAPPSVDVGLRRIFSALTGYFVCTRDSHRSVRGRYDHRPNYRARRARSDDRGDADAFALTLSCGRLRTVSQQGKPATVCNYTISRSRASAGSP
jgi:hypothetical protein